MSDLTVESKVVGNTLNYKITSIERSKMSEQTAEEKFQAYFSIKNVWDEGTIIKKHAAAVAEAVKNRDMEWWEAVICVDNVAPTPEAGKKFVAGMTEHWVKEAVLAENQASCQALLDYLNRAKLANFCRDWLNRIEDCLTIVQRLHAPKPAPVWCKPDCPYPKRFNDGVWVYYGGNHIVLSDLLLYCAYCGAPRPKEQDGGE